MFLNPFSFFFRIGQFLVSSGLRAAGFNHVNTDDGWDTYSRNANGTLQPDPNKFPQGIIGVVQNLSTYNISFGIYSAASSVVCSGRPGTLYYEALDAQTFASWGVSLVKYDNCGEYSLGLPRFTAFADAVAATGQKMVISTEPFSLVPNNLHAEFAHYWRTGNDIDASWNTIIDRIDRNDKWQAYAGPGHFNDPDMLQVGNGGLSDGENRAHFGLWAITKSPLILGSDLRKLTANQIQILSNTEVIAVNQDPLGIQAKKLAINGTLTPKFVGLTPCSNALLAPSPDGTPFANGVTPQTLTWTAISQGMVNGSQTYTIYHNATGRCLGTRYYVDHIAPMLVPCVENPQLDLTQSWIFPTGTVRLGALQNLAAVLSFQAGTNPSNATVLTVANTTIYGTIHGQDTFPLSDFTYGINKLTLAPYAPEPPCDNRNCQNYDPTQMWYISQKGQISLGMAGPNMYRCFEGPCYVLTSHMPALDAFCLSSVASVSNDGLDPTTTTTGGYDIYGGPLSNNTYVFGVLNRNSVSSNPIPITVEFSMLEDPNINSNTQACVRELYSGTSLGVVTGSVTYTVPPHDLAILKVFPGATSC